MIQLRPRLPLRALAALAPTLGFTRTICAAAGDHRPDAAGVVQDGELQGRARLGVHVRDELLLRERGAAEGGVTAYEEVVGEAWKPFQRQVESPGQTVDRKAAELQMAALG